MITHLQRCNRLWVGRGLKVWNGDRHQDFRELLEGRDMIEWNLKTRGGLGGLAGYV
jgi:hypothetical protein